MMENRWSSVKARWCQGLKLRLELSLCNWNEAAKRERIVKKTVKSEVPVCLAKPRNWLPWVRRERGGERHKRSPSGIFMPHLPLQKKIPSIKKPRCIRLKPVNALRSPRKAGQGVADPGLRRMSNGRQAGPTRGRSGGCSASSTVCVCSGVNIDCRECGGSTMSRHAQMFLSNPQGTKWSVTKT